MIIVVPGTIQADRKICIPVHGSFGGFELWLLSALEHAKEEHLLLPALTFLLQCQNGHLKIKV